MINKVDKSASLFTKSALSFLALKLRSQVMKRWQEQGVIGSLSTLIIQ